MASILSSSSDGTVQNLSTSSFAEARDATSGSRASGTRTTVNFGQGHTSGRVGERWLIQRTFLDFDTSGISVEPTAATLNITGTVAGTADYFVVKGTQDGVGGTALDTDDFDAIDGWSNSGVDNEGNVTKYSAESGSWNTSGNNAITLTAAALSDMVSLDTLKVCLLTNKDLRYDDLSVGEQIVNVGFMSEEGEEGAIGSSAGGKVPDVSYTAGGAVTYDANFFGANF